MALARSERRFGYEASEDRVHGVILIRVHSRSVTRPPPHGGQTALNPELEHPMPLARIDLIKGKLETYRQAIGEAVYQALLSIGVPEDDRFQVHFSGSTSRPCASSPSPTWASSTQTISS